MGIDGSDIKRNKELQGGEGQAYKYILKGGLFLGLIFVLFFTVSFYWYPRDTENHSVFKDNAELRPSTDIDETKMIKDVTSCYSVEDGSHLTIDKYLKEHMIYPDSFEHIRTVHGGGHGGVDVSMDFKGKNKFLKVVITSVTTKTDSSCNIIYLYSFLKK